MKDCGCGGKSTKPVHSTAKTFGAGSATGKKLTVTVNKAKKTTRVKVGKNK